MAPASYILIGFLTKFQGASVQACKTQKEHRDLPSHPLEKLTGSVSEFGRNMRFVEGVTCPNHELNPSIFGSCFGKIEASTFVLVDPVYTKKKRV